MNLSKEELQFIETYLKNSDVVYTDIRLELTDHVASAIEVELEENPSGTFYEVFKSYMVQNKKNLLKNHEEQKKKISRKIILRFGKGFLAKEVLFLMVLAVLSPRFLELNFSEDTLMCVNFGIGIVILLFYFFKFHKVKKTSIGGSLISIIYVPMYTVYYLRSPLTFLVVVLLMILFCRYEMWIIDRKERAINKIGLEWFTLIMFFTGILFFIPLVASSKWLAQFDTNDMMTSYFFFQLIMWYVLLKTLMTYKKELDKKYKGIFS